MPLGTVKPATLFNKNAPKLVAEWRVSLGKILTDKTQIKKVHIAPMPILIRILKINSILNQSFCKFLGRAVSAKEAM